ncbi:MAG: 6-carboxytetrahydropterin synthase [Alistipes sp.]|nr:6-carboxytetrahydropterin synthase [Alistipes sp.]
MAVIRLTKEFSFEAAHALEGYDGKCRHIHGHSYRLAVTVIGTPRKGDDDPKAGMTLDFGVLKSIVSSEIVERLDHTLIVRRGAGDNTLLDRRFGNIVEVDYRPTCENMLADFAGRLAVRMPEGVRLHSMRLHETATSYAEWYAEDQ